MDEVGWKFWGILVAVFVAAIVGIVLIFKLINVAWEKWGALGVVLFIVLGVLVFAWILDRRASDELSAAGEL
jgi:hypothetical protein